MRLLCIQYDDQQLEGDVTELQHPIHFMFYVKFSNGYENIFFTDPETGKWIEQDIGASEFAAVVGDKLNFLLPINHEKQCLSINWFHGSFNGSIFYFGYHSYWLDDFVVFEIFAPNKRFLYSLVKLKKDHWKVFRLTDSGWSGDLNVLYDLPFILEKYVLAPLT